MRKGGFSSISMNKVRCFVAMPIGKSDTDSLFKNVISKTVRAMGFTPIRVDLLNHNDRVDSKIRSEIKKSDILIADLTYARPSVYWEAGYAERAIPVIYMVRKDHFKGRPIKEDPLENYRVHFDLANANIIPWTETSIFVTKQLLKKRLELISKPILQNLKTEIEIEKSRTEFSSKSLAERSRLINEAIIDGLRRLGYGYRTEETRRFGKLLEDRAEVVEITSVQKRIGTTFIDLAIFPCRNSISQSLLKKALVGRPQNYEFGLLQTDFKDWEALPARIRKLGRRRIKGVRNIWIIPSIAKIRSSTIEDVLRTFNRIGAEKTYYRAVFYPDHVDRRQRVSKHPKRFMRTSCEIIFIDNILSLPDLDTRVDEVIRSGENQKNTMVRPESVDDRIKKM